LTPLLQHTQSRNIPEGWYYAKMYDSIANVLNDTYLKGRAKILLGTSAYYEGDLVMATDYFLKAQEQYMLIQDTTALASTYNNLGAVYDRRGLYQESLEIALKAFKLYSAKGDLRKMAISNTNLGTAYSKLDSFEKATYHFKESVKLYTNSEWKDQSAQPLSGLANIAYKQNNYPEAIVFADKALEIVSSTRGLESKFALLHIKTNSLIKLKKYEAAKAILDQANDLVVTNDLKIKKADMMDMWVDYYKLSGKWEKAFVASQKRQAYIDSTQNLIKDKNIEEVIQKYEAKQKEQQIALLNTEKLLTDTKLESTSKRYKLAGIGGLILLGFLAYVLSLNRKLTSAISDKNVLLKEIHHRVKNNLQVISALLTLQSSYVKDEVAVDALKRGQDRVESMALIHKNLYQHDNLKGVNAQDYIERLAEHLISSYKMENQKIDLQLSIDDIMLDVDTMIPLGLIINELISNSLKHAFSHEKNGSITIELKEKVDYLSLKVSDNGCGESEEPNATASFGQSLIKSLSRRLNAEVSVASEVGYSVALRIREYKKSA
jgi:two-component sensor histidine kinase